MGSEIARYVRVLITHIKEVTCVVYHTHFLMTKIACGPKAPPTKNLSKRNCKMVFKKA